MGGRSTKSDKIFHIHGNSCSLCQIPTRTEGQCDTQPTCCEVCNQKNYGCEKASQSTKVSPKQKVVAHKEVEPSYGSIRNYMETPSTRRRSSSLVRAYQPPKQSFLSVIPQNYAQKSYKPLQQQIEPDQEMTSILQHFMNTNNQQQRPETPVPVPLALPTNLNLQQIASMLKPYLNKEPQTMMHQPQVFPTQTFKYMTQKPLYQKNDIASFIEQLQAYSSLSKSNIPNSLSNLPNSLPNNLSKPYKSVVPAM